MFPNPKDLQTRPAPGQPGYIEWRTALLMSKIKRYLDEMAELHPDFSYNVSKVKVAKAQKPEMPKKRGNS